MKRFILLYRGSAPLSGNEDARVRSTPKLTVLDHEQERLWLVQADETELRTAFGNLSDWRVSEERPVDLSNASSTDEA